MFDHKVQRTFEYLKHKGTPLTIDGRMRRKQFATCSTTQSSSNTNPIKQTQSKDSTFKVLKTQVLRQKASKIQSQHKQNAGFMDNVIGKKDKRRIERRGSSAKVEIENRKSGIQYLVGKSPFEEIRDRKFTPSSEWFLKLNSTEAKDRKLLRHSISRKQQKDQVGHTASVNLPLNRRHFNLESHIVLG